MSHAIKQPSFRRRLFNRTVRRGMGNGMRYAVQGFSAAAETSRTERTSTSSKTPIPAGSVVELLTATHYLASGTYAETDFPMSLFMQRSLEVSYQNQLTGLDTTVRYPFTATVCSPSTASGNGPGTTTACYNGPGTNPSGRIKWSLTLPAGIGIPAGAKFGICRTTEVQAGTASAGTSGLPYNETASSFLNRYEGVLSTSTVGGTSYISTNATQMQTSYGALSTIQSGSNLLFHDICLIVDTPANARVALIGGSSDMDGVGEGVTGSGSNGDSCGNLARNCGWAPRLINDVFGHNYVKLCRGGDGSRYNADPSNRTYRNIIAQDVNPTDFFEDPDHNTFSITGAGGFPGVSVGVTKYQVFRNGTGSWMYVEAGTSGASPPANTNNDPTARYQDGSGTAHYKYVGPYAGAQDGVAAAVYALRAKLRDGLRALLPNANGSGVPVKIIAGMSALSSTSARTLASLTPNGKTVTAVLASGQPDTSSLTVGEAFGITGATSTFNSVTANGRPTGDKIVASIVNATTFTYTNPTDLGTTAAATPGSMDDGWQSVAGQSPVSTTLYNGTTSIRYKLYAIDYLQAQDPVFKWDRYVDVYGPMEAAPVDQSGLWKPGSSFQQYENDGIHSNSTGYMTEAASITVDPMSN